MHVENIAFKYYLEEKVSNTSNTHFVTFDVFEKMSQSIKIVVPTTRTLPEIAWVVRGVCLHKRTFIDKIKDFFSFLGYESSTQKADRIYYAVLKINSEQDRDLS